MISSLVNLTWAFPLMHWYMYISVDKKCSLLIHRVCNPKSFIKSLVLIKSKLPVMMRCMHAIYCLQSNFLFDTLHSLLRTASFEEIFQHNFWTCASHYSLSSSWRPRYGVVWNCSRVMPLNSRDNVLLGSSGLPWIAINIHMVFLILIGKLLLSNHRPAS